MAAGGGGAPPAAAAAAPSAATAAPVEPREGGGAGGVWRVYTDLKQVRDGLRDARFELVGSAADARDVLWLGEHIVDFEGAAEGGAVLNQFPHESCLTAKNLLGRVRARGARSAAPSRGSPTRTRCRTSCHGSSRAGRADAAAGGAPPLFICKPWSSSRSQGVLIASELHQVLGICRPAYGPKLACEYVRSPLLVRGRKFDLRLYVAVASLRPPRFYVCRRWYARLANLPLDGAPLSERLAHLTVAKYDGVDQDFLSDRECVAWLDDDAAAAAQGWRGWDELAPRVNEMLATAFAPLVDRAADALDGRPLPRTLRRRRPPRRRRRLAAAKRRRRRRRARRSRCSSRSTTRPTSRRRRASAPASSTSSSRASSPTTPTRRATSGTRSRSSRACESARELYTEYLRYLTALYGKGAPR